MNNEEKILALLEQMIEKQEQMPLSPICARK